jgi:hypothetical protein
LGIANLILNKVNQCAEAKLKALYKHFLLNSKEYSTMFALSFPEFKNLENKTRSGFYENRPPKLAGLLTGTAVLAYEFDLACALRQPHIILAFFELPIAFVLTYDHL